MSDSIELKAKLKLDTADAEDQLKQVGDKTASMLKPVFSKSEGGLGKITEVAKGASSGIGGLGKSLSGLASIAGVAVKSLGAAATVIAIIMKLFSGTDTGDQIKRTIDGLMHALQTVLAPALALLGELFIDVARIVQTILVPIFEMISGVLAVILTPIVGIVKVLMPLIAVIAKVLEVISALSSIFSDTLLGIITSIIDVVVIFINAAVKPLLDILQKAVDFFNMLKDAIQSFITTISGGLIQFGASLASTTGMKGDYASSLDAWETSGTGITAGDELVSDSITSKLGGVIEKLEGLFTNMKEFFKPVVDGINAIVDKLLPPIIAVMKSFFTVLGTALDMLVKAMEGIGNVILAAFDGFASIFTGLTKTINAIKRAMNTAIIDPINSVLGKVKGVSIAGWKPFDFISQIKRFEKGGTVDGMQVWGMSESGNPEFMFNSGGHNTVINADILEDAMFRAVTAANARSGNKLEVSVKAGTPAGPRDLAQWVLPSLKFALGK